LFDIPPFLQPLLGNSARAAALLYGGIGLLVLANLLLLWLVFGAGPRRRRGLAAARRLLKAGNWAEALARVRGVRHLGIPSASWRRRFDHFEGECLQAGAHAALTAKQFEEALAQDLKAARLLDRSETEVRLAIQTAMLREVRRLFSLPGETRATADLIARTLLVQSPCREASFWQGLCDLRESQAESALANLQVARTGQGRSLGFDAGLAEPPPSVSSFLDPPLYLGALLLRQGQAKEALRYLTEANRLDPGCPFVTLQLGAALIASGGDTQLAVRALQRALGPRGLGQWERAPQRAWAEGLPEQRSYIRKLASEFPFTCPLWGNDLQPLLRQGHLALAQGQFRLGKFAEAAQLFDQALKEGAPSLAVLRGLGLAQAKLGRYDDAFKHLLTAHDLEQGKDRLTAGYLALCGACGTPTSAADRANNIAWAVRTVQQWSAPGDGEWIGLLDTIFAEARAHAIPLSADDQLYLCEHLLSGAAADARAAAAYHHLMATFPHLVRPEYAWLYCRADEQHQVNGAHMLELYALAWADRTGAAAFYAARHWDLDAVELAYLARAAERAPGRFPEALGPAYAPRGERLLLDRSRAQEQAGHAEEALATIEILVALAPHNTGALDRAAALHYRAGRLERAAELLRAWAAACPAEPLPLVRQGVLLQQLGNEPESCAQLRQAMALCTGRRRAGIAFLGARLLLQGYFRSGGADLLDTARAFLEECLHHEPAHADALWCLAAVRWLQGDRPGLARQAEVMRAAATSDACFYYFAALCHEAAGASEQALEACRRAQEGHAARAGARLNLATESRYLAALAELSLSRPDEAAADLSAVAQDAASPSAALALALLGRTRFAANDLDEAIRCWQALDVKQRQSWGLTEPLGQTMFASALKALLASRFEEAADRFRQAGRLGCRERRLGPLLLVALFKAGQQAIYTDKTAPVRAER
jgi:tetratricopeptide (TPR) repeat protein